MKPSNGRIIRNTGLLYFRLIFLTFINLYAVRVTLEALGIIDYGLYNVIASVVAALSILTGAMTSASQRFLAFHLGKGDYEKYSHTFTLLLLSFLILCGILIVIGEALGYFFIEDWLNIPQDRIKASYWVYQTSLAAFAIGFITIPYTSSIIANERMDAFALFSIVEGVLKLAIAFMLSIYGGDRLILYGILTAFISLVVLFMSMQYCHSRFKYCKYIWKWDKSIFGELSKYTGWNLFGSISAILASQGQNILLNIFFGPVINTAKAIADRIQNVVNGFSINLYMAVSPQIIKSYASEDYTRAINLVIRTSKMSFLLIFIIAFPLISNMDGLLEIWLAADSKTPDTTAFSKLILLYCLALSLEPPISRLIQATGNIKRYQLIIGAIMLSYIPIAALILHLGGGAIFTVAILIAITVIAQVARVIIAHQQVGVSYSSYIRGVVAPLIKVSFAGGAAYIMMADIADNKTLLMTLFNTIAAALCGLFIAAALGLDKKDRETITTFIKEKIKR
ncbi:MAG: hypothetical protein K2G77_05595 [Muribaculaceae bacterium]|nr:hypothetical protein [Muribaculaceae bacterium]